jgi:hypothetical protein
MNKELETSVMLIEAINSITVSSPLRNTSIQASYRTGKKTNS